MKPIRFEALDAFRGLCAIFVVVHHMRITNTFTELSFFRNGDVFVEFFFVLSGFVLAHGYGFKEEINLKPFMVARFFRVYPLHFVMFLVFFIFEIGKWAAYQKGIAFNSEPFTGQTAFAEIIPNLLLIQAWSSVTEWSYNFPSWSISIELYMYMLLYFSIVVLKQYKVLGWLLISILMFVLIFSGDDSLVSAVKRGLSCFFGGAFVYYIYKKTNVLRIPAWMGSFIEASLIIAVAYVVSADFAYQKGFSSLLFLFVIWFFAFESGAVSRALLTSSLQYLGKLSYSIYMTHAAIIMAVLSVLMIVQKLAGINVAPTIEGTRFISLGNGLYNYVALCSILFFTVLVSSQTYKYIEKKGRAFGRRFK